MQGCNDLSPVPGLDGMESRYTVRDILHISPGNLVPGHLPDTKRDAGDPQPVRSICTKRHGPGGAYNGEITVIKDAIHHTRQYHASLRTPAHPTEPQVSICFVAGSNAGFKKWPQGRIDARADRQHLFPYHIRFKRPSQVIGNLFADHIPFGFGKVMIPLVIKPDRTCIHPYYIRNRYMFLKLLQDYSSCRSRKPEGLYLFKFPRRKMSDTWPDLLIANLFHAGDANLIS